MWFAVKENVLDPLGDAAPRKCGLVKIMRWRRSAVASLVIRRSHLLNEKKKEEDEEEKEEEALPG